MTAIGDALYSYSNRKSSSSSIAIEGMTREEEDAVLASYPQLIQESYKGWFAIRLKKLGKKEFVRRADHAIKYGKNPQKLFSNLVK